MENQSRMGTAADALRDAVSLEIDVARELEALLEREAAELGGASPERIEELASSKADLARRAAESAKARDAALAGAGLPAGRRGLESARSGGPEWERRVAELYARARHVRLLNDRNGAYVGLRLRHCLGALDVLLRGGPNTAETYARDGMAHAGGLSRSRATA